MKIGRPRKQPENLPAHIDWSKVPAGIYWDPRWRRWYTRERKAGKASTRYVAGADARLSDLHVIAEQLAGIERGTLRWLCGEFSGSPQHAALSAATRADYAYCRTALCDWPTKAGKVGDLVAARITRPLVQRLIDTIAAGTDGKPTPSKAAHVRRYLSRVWEWAANRGYVPAANPATGIDQPRERRQRRLPDAATMAAVIEHARQRGQLGHGADGACPSYLWAVAEIAYLARLRGIEVVTLTEAAATAEGLRTNRRKGSRDNVVAWTPRLRAAWAALLERRDAIWQRRKSPVPIRPEQRPVVVGSDGQRLSKSALDTAWQRMIHGALEAGVIAAADRFALHDLKRRGVTDTPGTRADKQEASGHRSEGMLDVYDLSVPVVPAAGKPGETA